MTVTVRPGLTTSEPAVVTGGLMGVFGAVVTALTAFDVIDLSTEQVASLAAVAVIVLPLVQGVITRQFVRPAKLSVSVPASVAAAARGRHAAPDDPVPPPDPPL